MLICGHWFHAFLYNYHQAYIYIYIYIVSKVGDCSQKFPFSIATTPRCRGGRYSFPWIAPPYPRFVPYIAEC